MRERAQQDVWLVGFKPLGNAEKLRLKFWGTATVSHMGGTEG